jgi:hypothetical protein
MPIGPIAAGRRRSSGGDPNWSNVTLLVGADGTNGATTFVDESPVGATLTRVGNTQISTAQSKFGGSSALFDGAGDAITTPNAAGVHFSTGQFTVEAFVRFATAPTNSSIISRWSATNGNNSWAFYLTASTLRFRFYDGLGSSGGGTLHDTDSAWSPAANTWYHVAADRDSGGIIRTYVDGVMKGKATFAQAFFVGSTTTDLGRVNGGFPQFDLNGYLDEVRITKGVARYASDAGYTVPTAAYPRT